MKYWYLKTDDGEQWGECEDNYIVLPDAKVYDTPEKRDSKHPKLKQTIRDHERDTKLAVYDVGQIEAMHAMKVSEAIAYKFLGAPPEACPMCLEYSKAEGMELDKVITTVWEKHLLSAKSEAARTSAKSLIRKSFQ